MPLPTRAAVFLAFCLSAFLAFCPAEARSPKPRDCGPLPATFEGPAYSIDGDGLAAIGLKPSIRLWGVQAPELRDRQTTIETVAGMRSRAWLEAQLDQAKHQVRCEPQTWDRFCRIVAICSAGGVDLSEGLLKAGMAYGFGRVTSANDVAATRLRYSEAEREARDARKGLWPAWLPATEP